MWNAYQEYLCFRSNVLTLYHQDAFHCYSHSQFGPNWISDFLDFEFIRGFLVPFLHGSFPFRGNHKACLRIL